MGLYKYRNNFKLTMHEDTLDIPNHIRKPKYIFVNSMSDLFHEDVSLSFIVRVFDTIRSNPMHTFQLLTKRPNRMVKLKNYLVWPKNLWVGVTVESQKYFSRILKLQEIPATIKFISFEPLLGPIQLGKLENIDWIIVGGETGPSYRPMDYEWVIQLRDFSIENGIPFFFKQWSGFFGSKQPRCIDGKYWHERPLPSNPQEGFIKQ